MKRILAAAALAALLIAPFARAGTVGGYPNASSPLNGTERILADQTAGSYPCVACTVNITPLQLSNYTAAQAGSFGLLFNNSGAIGGLAPVATGQYCLDWASLTAAPTLVTCTGGGSTAFQVNGTALTSSTTVNFENSVATNGVTLTFTNPSAGNVQVGLTGTLNPAGGGTGLTTTPTNGQLLIGNGTGYTLAALTAGANMSITNGAGSISLAAVPSGSNTYVQFNSSGAFGGSTYLTWNGSSNVFNVGATSTPGTVSVGALDSMIVNGTPIPVPGFALNSNIQGVIENHSYTTGTSAGAARLYLARSDGSITSPSIVVNGDHLGTIYGVGFNGTTNNYLAGGYMQFIVDGTPSGTAMPSDWILALAGATGAPAQVMRAYSNGGVVVGAPTGGNEGAGTLNAAGLYVNGAAALYSGGPLGTPSSGVATNLTGTASGLTAGTATAANGLNSATTTVSVSAATAPTSGQVLTATSGTAATWQTPTTGSGTVNSGTSGQLAYYAATGTAVSGATLGNGLTISSGTLSTTQVLNAQTGTTYTVATTDANKFLTFNNASAVAVTLPAATTTGFGAGFAFTVQNTGAGLVTITPTTSTINGAATLTIPTNTGCGIVSDGTNYQVGACGALQAQVDALPSGISATPSCAYKVNTVTSTAYTIAAPTNGALTQTAGGSLAATTYYVKSTWVTASGQTTGSTETSLAVSASNVLNVAAPASPPANATGWDVYVSTATGTETLQASDIGTTTAWVEPTSGLVTGAALPTTNTSGLFTVNLPAGCTPTNGQSLTLQIISAAGGTLQYAPNSGYLSSITVGTWPADSGAASEEDDMKLIYIANAPTPGWLLSAYIQGIP